VSSLLGSSAVVAVALCQRVAPKKARPCVLLLHQFVSPSIFKSLSQNLSIWSCFGQILASGGQIHECGDRISRGRGWLGSFAAPSRLRLVLLWQRQLCSCSPSRHWQSSWSGRGSLPHGCARVHFRSSTRAREELLAASDEVGAAAMTKF
jgi:hypothetical protein